MTNNMKIVWIKYMLICNPNCLFWGITFIFRFKLLFIELNTKATGLQIV